MVQMTVAENALAGPTPDRRDKVFALLLFGLAIELIFFKFLPDLATAMLPHQFPSSLADFKVYEAAYLNPGSVGYPRFAGNWILFGLARLLAGHIHSGDVRLHPLRIAAAILTPLYAVIGLGPVLARTTRYRWRTYLALYCSYCVISLYVFYPGDMPSIALLSVAAFLILEQRLGAALIVMLLTGLFRESSLHAVWFVFAWAICNREVAVTRRVVWTLVYLLAFVIEYFVIRIFFPGHGSILLDPHEIFFGHGLWSLTCIVTLSVVAIVPVHYLATRGVRFGHDWRRNFFILNCAASPAWIIFYRIMGGNISELRMLLPILLPIFYGLAIGPAKQPAPNPGAAAGSRLRLDFGGDAVPLGEQIG
jgi:hypothetical protein